MLAMNDAVTNEADDVCCHPTRRVVGDKRTLFRNKQVKKQARKDEAVVTSAEE